MLNRDELARADAFVFAHDRARFRAGRWLLKALLARYLSVATREVELVPTTSGKPQLARHGGLHFNVSHSADIYVAAVSAVADIGVDIEIHREMPDAFQVAEMVFSPAEIDELRSTAAHQIVHRFLHGWTRKEAFIKAVGVGLGGADLKAIYVGLDNTERVAQAQVGIAPEALVIRSLAACEGEYVALAAPAAVRQVMQVGIDRAALTELGLMPV